LLHPSPSEAVVESQGGGLPRVNPEGEVMEAEGGAAGGAGTVEGRALGSPSPALLPLLPAPPPLPPPPELGGWEL